MTRHRLPFRYAPLTTAIGRPNAHGADWTLLLWTPTRGWLQPA